MQRFKHHGRRILPTNIRVGKQRGKPGFGRLDTFEFGLGLGVIFARFKVNDFFLFLAPLIRHHAVETAFAFAAGIALRNHFLDKSRQCIARSERVFFGQGCKHGFGNKRHEVNADKVIKPEQPGLGEAQRLAHHRVGLLDRYPKANRLKHPHRHPVNTDAVGEESGRIFARHHFLAEHLVGKCTELGEARRIKPRRLHHLKQFHEARRVEKMGNQKIFLERFRHALNQHMERQGRGIGRNDGTLLPHGFNFLVKRLFDFELLNHYLDDPVAFGEFAQIILEITRYHRPRIFRVGEPRRAALQLLFNRPFGECVSARLIPPLFPPRLLLFAHPPRLRGGRKGGNLT